MSGSSAVSVRNLHFGVGPAGVVTWSKGRYHDAVGSLPGSDPCRLEVEGSRKGLRGWNGDSAARCCRKEVEARAATLWPFVDQTRLPARLAALRCLQRLRDRTNTGKLPACQGATQYIVVKLL